MSEVRSWYDEASRKTVVQVELSDHELRRNHLVPLPTEGSAEALAYYALHCLKTIRDAEARPYHRKETGHE